MSLSYLSVDKLHQVVLDIKLSGICNSWSFPNPADIPRTVITEASKILVENAFLPDWKRCPGTKPIFFVENFFDGS